MGYFAARWEGHALVVERAGFDPRTLLDHYGNVHSEYTRLEERFTRTGPDAIELEMTIHDPMTYTEPWVAEKTTWYRITPESLEVDRWPGLWEDVFVPLDEVDDFNRRIRDPSDGVAR